MPRSAATCRGQSGRLANGKSRSGVLERDAIIAKLLVVTIVDRRSVLRVVLSLLLRS
jgi:hypothetical protein